jgi:hypothetical protein
MRIRRYPRCENSGPWKSVGPYPGSWILIHCRYMECVPLFHLGRKRGTLSLRRGRNMQDLGYDLPRTPLLGTWVNKPAWRSAGVRCVACFEMIVATDTCEGQVLRVSSSTLHGCGEGLPDRVCRSSSSGWLCRDELGNLQQGEGTFTRSNSVHNSVQRGRPMRGDEDHQEPERRAPGDLYHQRPTWLPQGWPSLGHQRKGQAGRRERR